MRMLLLLFMLLPVIVSAQSIIVQGKVVDDAGNIIPYASVFIRGAKTGTVSDKDGNFRLAVSRLPVTIICSAAGYNSFQAEANKENFNALVLKLQAYPSSLSEVVVVSAYVTSEKSMHSVPGVDRTGSERVSRKLAGTPAAIKDKSRYSRILTAGEVNDFKKWKLWSDYTSSEFRSLSDEWQLVLKKRYCVQVQNEKHMAVTGEKVWLIDNTSSDTIWSAVTDNTGKAELWADFSGDDAVLQHLLIACSGRQIPFPVPFESGINRFTISRACKVSPVVDLAFVVDATGSMGDEIRYLQGELQDVIERTAADYADVQFRFGSVFYRDHGDEYVTRQLDFQDKVSVLSDFIRMQSADGGGDFPEAMDVALEEAIDKLHWSSEARSRILFLVMDAPPHAQAKERMKHLLEKAAARGIRIVPVSCSGVNKSTEYLMRCAALSTNGSYVFLTDDSGVGNPHIKPTIDEFKVELLNDLMQRLLGEMIQVNACAITQQITDTARTVPPQDLVKVKLYPNPTSGRVMVESTTSIRHMFLADFAGKLLVRIDTRDRKRKWQLNLGNHPSGTYLLRYFNEETGWGTEKIVLIH